MVNNSLKMIYLPSEWEVYEFPFELEPCCLPDMCAMLVNCNAETQRFFEPRPPLIVRGQQASGQFEHAGGRGLGWSAAHGATSSPWCVTVTMTQK
jgi:hypothetical protein